MRQHLADVKKYRIQTLLQFLRDQGYGSPAERSVVNYVKNLRSRGGVDSDIVPTQPRQWTKADFAAAAARYPKLEDCSEADDLALVRADWQQGRQCVITCPRMFRAKPELSTFFGRAAFSKF